jgi:predicted alpha/beta-fold hydrolase
MSDKVSAEEYCKSIIESFKSKSTHNKNESIYFFWISMGGALLAPLFVTLGEDIANCLGTWGSVFVFSKLIPSILSIAVAFSTAWLQLRKPQQLWALYRTSQRELENCLSEFQHKIRDFENCNDCDKLLAKKVSEIALSSHYAWLPMVPNPESVSSSSSISIKENE